MLLSNKIKSTTILKNDKTVLNLTKTKEKYQYLRFKVLSNGIQIFKLFIDAQMRQHINVYLSHTF